MTTFYICRHGETENNKNRLLSGWVDTPLTEEGAKNAEACAKKLQDIEIDKIITSDLGRAYATAVLIAKDIGFTDNINKFKELREINYGTLANTAIANYPSMTPTENTDFVPEGGESLKQMEARVVRFIKDYTKASDNKTILIVAHDGTIKAILATFLDRNIGVVDSEITIPHDSVIRFAVQNGHIIDWTEIH